MIVVKLGGARGIDPSNLLREIANRSEAVVLVHGGNEELTQLQERLGQPATFVTSPSGHTSRLTDPDTIAAIQMAYRGRINNDLVRRLQNLGCNAVGISGVDGRVLVAKRKDAIRILVDGKPTIHRGDYTGRIESVNTQLLTTLLASGFTPVVTLPALATDGSVVNVDGDRAAASIAAALGANELLILSRVPGLLENVEDPASLVRTLAVADLDGNPHAQGRFKKKLLAAKEAIEGGVERVILATTEHESPITHALAGEGTVIQ